LDIEDRTRRNCPRHPPAEPDTNGGIDPSC